MRAAFSQGMTSLQLYVERPKENLNICNYLNKCHQSKLVGIMQDYKEKCTLYLRIKCQGCQKISWYKSHINREFAEFPSLAFMAAPPILVSYSKCFVYTRK